jgi:WD40 repeat protein
MWNALWWVDSREAAEWQNAAADQTAVVPNQSGSPGSSRSEFVEAWREWKERRSPGFTWLRAVSPSARRQGEYFFLQGHTSFISALETSADGLTALSASGDRSLRLWDVTAARQIGYRNTTESRIDVIRFCETVGSHGAFLAGDANGTLFLWDARSLDTLARVAAHSDGIRAIAVFDAGQWAVSAGRDGSLVVHELPTLRQLARWQTQEHVIFDGSVKRYEIYSVTVDPRNQDVLFTVETDIYRWNWRSGTCAKWLTCQQDGMYTLCEVSRDGDRVAIWRISNQDPEYPTDGGVFPIAILEDLSRLPDEVQPEELADRSSLGGCSCDVAESRFSPDGNALVVADSAASGMWLWQPPDRFCFVGIPGANPFPPYGGVHSVAFAAKGFVLCGTGNRTIPGWNMRSLDHGLPSTHIAQNSLILRLSLIELPGSDSVFLLDPKGRYFILTELNDSEGENKASRLVFHIGNPRHPASPCKTVSGPVLSRMDLTAFISCSAISQNGARAVFGFGSGQIAILDYGQENGEEVRLIALPILATSNVQDRDSPLEGDSSPETKTGGEDSFSIKFHQLPSCIAAVAISHLGGIVVAATQDGRVTAWQDGPHTQWVTSIGDAIVTTFAIAADEETVAVGAEDGSVTLLKISDGQILGQWESDADVTGLKNGLRVVFLYIDALRERIACGFSSGALRWLDTKTGDWTVGGQVTYFADFPSIVAPHSGHGYALQRIDNEIAVISPATRQPVTWVPSGIDDLSRTFVDESVSVIVTRGGDARFYVREGADVT